MRSFKTKKAAQASARKAQVRVPGLLTMRPEPEDSSSYAQFWVDCPPDPTVPGQTVGAPFANAYSEEYAREIVTACNAYRPLVDALRRIVVSFERGETDAPSGIIASARAALEGRE